MIVRVVVNDDVHARKQVRDVMVELDRVLHMQSFVIGHTEENTIRAEVFDKIHLLNNFARIGTGNANKKRDTLSHCFDGSDS